MGDIDVGGDRSVMWKVNAGHLRANTAKSQGAGGGPPGGHGAGQHHQEGVDETNPGDFTIYIEVPATSKVQATVAAALEAASVAMKGATPGSSGRVSFSLPIEPDNEDQIRITWDSMP